MAKRFNENLIELLKTDSRFVDAEGELVTAAVIDRAWKIDRELVKLLLAELLNKNQLYVNLSEIDDADFGVSEDDKKLNRLFYGDAYSG